MRYTLLVAVILIGACRDKGIQPRRTVAADSADQWYGDMTTETSRNGIRTSVVHADSAYMYEQRGVADLFGMTVKMFDSSGNLISTITAVKGLYHLRDQHLDARGHVVATSSGGRVLKTEHLVFDNPRNLITSDTAFTSTSPQANLSGAHFEADPGFKNVSITKLKGGQKGKGVPLPGQRGGGGR